MAKKHYEWGEGATLDDHSKKKHSILRRYFRQYLITRCQFPMQERFRVAIVDGFAGGGVYQCGSPGSPLIFIDVLMRTTNEINLRRSNNGMRPIQIDCLLILNDSTESAVEELKKNITPALTLAKNECQALSTEVVYFTDTFENMYRPVKNTLVSAKCSNVFFNLDQCGYSHVTSAIIRDIVSSWRSAEVLLTFMIGGMLTYLSPQKKSVNTYLEPGIREKIDALLANGENLLNKKEWLGEAEKITFAHLKDCATFVSPFSINNPNGWRYWLMHFSNSYRARQVYNDVLHQDGAKQAHFGRSGLKMLSYDPQDEGQLYLFDEDSRTAAKEALYDDIPAFIAEAGDTLSVQDFYAAAYSETPAHSDDIHEMIYENPDVEVITGTGAKRRQASTIKPADTLKLKSQKSLLFMFSHTPKKQ